ncbi:uncharacterized protein LOC107271577 [Cephus cinctus]|uniref:Uncharacterized protein LOC107271577 n=1 Tax=Cephus cinctus TaxID=211228 RepID=A0AAJ7FQG9_CEPCN|nr:uncharacterized protein LOC107271577 [Cephus cinctus]XP_024944515.1 uncharacterized protein LOC107271577 [Cephus cinctus]
MIKRFIQVVLCILALATTLLAKPNGDRYPAGVNPQSCPNYPNCDNAALHSGRASTPSWSPQGGAWAPAGAPAAPWAQPASPWNAPHSAGNPASAGAQYPAGVNPQSCPNYPQCDNAALHGGAPANNDWNEPSSNSWDSWDSWSDPSTAQPAAVAPRYPAGVSQQSCPNYPYC